MKKVFLFLIFLMQILLCFAQKNQLKLPSDNKLKISLDTLVEQSVSAFMKNNSRVGISIGIIKDGKSYLYNYGSIQKEKSELPTGNTVYELASITKTFGATLLAKAVLDKKVNLDDDIRKYLKEDYPNLNYNGKPITLLHLVNLTSGLPNWMPDKDIFGKANPDSIPYILDSVHTKYSRQDFYRDLHHVKLQVLPGSTARHCNTAAQLLGYIMEIVYNNSYENLLKIHFAEPLKMKNTLLLTLGKLPSKMAKGYDGKGRVMPIIDWEDLQVAASIASSSSDMLKYMKFHLNEVNAIAKLSHQPTFGKVEDGAIALNWKVRKTENGKRSISHTGGSLGFSSYMVFYPDLNSGIVLLSNEADQGTQNELIALSDKIIKP
ncbi:CubicO group peptidase (beta-lactamase class C family) [Mucilaginibacter gracilis]|uniref:CubicO group peptidase (Beta-lactamase class C family) n=1 Tax=Mucilaginibacter gracilis TaxID=423350 RepID=A0A495J5G3_9SPHI|nr:serine hydrolase domain-containing protein [Mucilaginibacter gracilis]RKR83993.1 CubicO group peptidase (beta-lactamase class C family) [Mucilaginibacter gracilis]